MIWVHVETGFIFEMLLKNVRDKIGVKDEEFFEVGEIVMFNPELDVEGVTYLNMSEKFELVGWL